MTPEIKLKQIRSILNQQQVDGFIVQRGDEFLNEYVAPYAERLAWLSGFTGSAGLVIVTAQKAAVFSDGRYILQMEQELDHAWWENYHITKNPPSKWLLDQSKSPIRLGYDPKLMSEKDLQSFENEAIILIPLEQNPIDMIWHEQPHYPCHRIVPHKIEFSGQDHQDKIKNFQKELIQNKEDAYILCDPASICWLLNIRGSDVPYTPIPLVYAIIKKDTVSLYANSKQYDENLSKFLESNIFLKSRDELEDDLKSLTIKSKVGFDVKQTPIWFSQTLSNAGITYSYRDNPCIPLKACKNAIEQEGARQAHLRDAIAMCRFLCWLENHAIGLTEIEVSEKLNEFRQKAGRELYREESFPAISGIGANGAIIHYHATPERQAVITGDQVYLIDSGGQYLDGTTDITRTVWIGDKTPSPDLKNAVTCVLQGHIALSSSIFPQGTTGSRLDVLARYALWQHGLDYDHGTGHGVGSFLSVHEGPCRISSLPFPVPLQVGMILSNEPGYYLQGQYGIRLENLMLVTPSKIPSFLCFEPLTLVPFDKNLIDVEKLSTTEKKWLNNYHQRVQNEVKPYLNPQEQQWLNKVCAPVT